MVSCAAKVWSSFTRKQKSLPAGSLTGNLFPLRPFILKLMNRSLDSSIHLRRSSTLTTRKCSANGSCEPFTHTIIKHLKPKLSSNWSTGSSLKTQSCCVDYRQLVFFFAIYPLAKFISLPIAFPPSPDNIIQVHATFQIKALVIRWVACHTALPLIRSEKVCERLADVLPA